MGRGSTEQDGVPTRFHLVSLASLCRSICGEHRCVSRAVKPSRVCWGIYSHLPTTSRSPSPPPQWASHGTSALSSQPPQEPPLATDGRRRPLHLWVHLRWRFLFRFRRLFVMPPALAWSREAYKKNGGVGGVRMAGSTSSRERGSRYINHQKVNVAKTDIPPQNEKPRRSGTVIALSTDCAALYATKNRRRASILSSAGDPRAHANHQQLSAQVRQAFLNCASRFHSDIRARFSQLLRLPSRLTRRKRLAIKYQCSFVCTFAPISCSCCIHRRT
ncbi:hypothetical protein M404DRAFT_543482 [Pisolithus tinctorius Marx 270]|uniref:Uncharacterized protein n=1 Tax=Pisolithus tinctorius Marx 270 TaxID=870435 RepID=A0A0C3P9N5_PISTI|nr:hypothetical protein M404DRAFT_543482 [Pisolithus tinctorius Marx 270]